MWRALLKKSNNYTITAKQQNNWNNHIHENILIKCLRKKKVNVHIAWIPGENKFTIVTAEKTKLSENMQHDIKKKCTLQIIPSNH